MFKVGDIVRYKNGWCSDGERKYLHIVREIRLNPVTNQMTRYLIETINMEHMTLNPTETVDECMIEYAEAEETKGDNTMISINTIKAIAERVRGEKTNLWRAAQGEDEILASAAWSDRTWADEVLAHCEAGTLTENDKHFVRFFGKPEELAETEEETDTTTNTNNEKENDTMKTNNTNSTKKSISVSNLTLDLYLDYVRQAAIRAGILEEAVTEEGRPDHITEEAIANEIESCMRCACFNAGNDGVQRSHEEYIAHEAEQMLYQIEVSIEYSKDTEVVEALEALKNAITAEAVVVAVEKKVSESKTRSAWDRGVKAYAEELVEELREAVECGYVDADDLSNRRLFEKAMLNGAADWRQYSEGCALCYNQDIAERLCAPWELRKTDNGRKDPNPRENWIDVQSRALFQAAQMVLRAAF